MSRLHPASATRTSKASRPLTLLIIYGAAPLRVRGPRSYAEAKKECRRDSASRNSAKRSMASGKRSPLAANPSRKMRWLAEAIARHHQHTALGKPQAKLASVVAVREPWKCSHSPAGPQPLQETFMLREEGIEAQGFARLFASPAHKFRGYAPGPERPASHRAHFQ